MKDRILQTLRDLRAYALAQNAVVSIDYHEEDSYLMRFANSAVSLNTNEHLIRLEITAYDGRKRASYELITNLDQVDEMKRGLDQAVEMARHAQALTYEPTIPLFTELFADDVLMMPLWLRSQAKNGWLISTASLRVSKRIPSACRGSSQAART